MKDMAKIIPPALQAGDEIRVIAPANGIKLIGPDCREIARARFAELGLKVSFGRNTVDENWEADGSSAIAKRLQDLHEAFVDPKVKGIFTIIGGHCSNQLLKYIDYDLIAANPKIFCGFSDITALLNAIYAKTGLETFSGPHYSSAGMKKGFEYSLQNMVKMLMGDGVNHLQPSAEWSDDLWFLDQENRYFAKNEGYWQLQPGEAEGTLIGGNLCTFNLLLGSQYRPAFVKDTVLFIEDTESSSIADFTRNLQALIYQPDFGNVKAILIGRFQKKSEVTREKLEFMLQRLQADLHGLPIIANLDFGHSTPLLTIPVGGSATISNGQITIKR